MISVIIPIYNVLQYVDRGLKYILSQDYSDFEVILVDDGSTDGSAALCDSWVEKDARIRVFHKENAGAGSARNVGIDNARGEYIYFFDIDDEVDPILLSECVPLMETYNLEMLQFGYSSYDVLYKTTTNVAFKEQLITSNNQLRDVYVDNCVLTMNGFPWNKMYRKSFLDRNKLRFENQRIQQDEVFNLKCYHYLNRCLFTDKILYHYFVYDHGNTRSRFIPDRYEIYKSVYSHFLSIKEHWQLNDSRFDDYVNNRLIGNLHALLRFNLTHKKCHWSKIEKCQEVDRVMNDVTYQKAIEWKKTSGMNIEERLFIHAYRKRSLSLVGLFDYIFSLIRKIRHVVFFKLSAAFSSMYCLSINSF